VLARKEWQRIKMSDMRSRDCYSIVSNAELDSK
jgi:hypothetical protein